jgi:hypothetical protein
MKELNKITKLPTVNALAPAEFMKKIIIENKTKDYSKELDPIVIKIENGVLYSNNLEIESAVSQIFSFVNENTEELSSDDIQKYIEIVSNIERWIKSNRIEKTKPFDELKKSFIASEKKLIDAKDILKIKQDKDNEDIFAVRRQNIADCIVELIGDLKEDIEIDVNLFNNFLDEKQKAKTYELNKSGKLSSPARNAIIEMFTKITRPIIDEFEEEKTQEKEHKQFLNIFCKIETKGSASVLKKSLEELQELKDNIDEFYPSVKSSVQMQISQTVNTINKNIEKLENKVSENKEDSSLKTFRPSADLIEFIKTCTVQSSGRASAKTDFIEAIKSHMNVFEMEEL